jgi:hypothetical protein
MDILKVQARARELLDILDEDPSKWAEHGPELSRLGRVLTGSEQPSYEAGDMDPTPDWGAGSVDSVPCGQAKKGLRCTWPKGHEKDDVPHVAGDGECIAAVWPADDAEEPAPPATGFTPGDPDPTPGWGPVVLGVGDGFPECPARQGGLRCTWRSGHEKENIPHVAGDGTRIVAVWG